MSLKGARNPIKTTQTSLHILEVLADTGGGTLSEITGRVNLTKGAVFNHLATLEEQGYVEREENEYHLSLSLLDLANAAIRRFYVTEAVRTRICSLAEVTGESASFVVKSGNEGMVATSFAGSQSAAGIRPGARISLCTTAAGRAILSLLPDDEVRSVHEESSDQMDLDTLFEQLTTARTQGIAISRGDSVPSRYSVATPVKIPGSEEVGAVNVSGPKERLTGKALEQDVAGLVVKAADDVKVRMREVSAADG